ncbi:sensor histidine kinase [Streptomyces carminius]|uniref:Oxygen sensor histidine kinase NreB n=2 Tax=Streptomyces carminius TaxID=2665496 RepID=A0A2M8M329_9ACTN|nr:sensor histidine kinase [Streptomyces carminius]
MSVEQPLWSALTGYRVLTMGYALALYAYAYDEYAHPFGAGAYLALLVLWTLATVRRVSSAERCTLPFLAADLSVALTGILLTPVVDTAERIEAGGPTLPTIWTAGAVLGFAIRNGWRWAAGASVLVGAANVTVGGLAEDTVHNVLLVCIASVAIGYVAEVARASERTLARALRIEAATRERERLARDIHDSVLQVLAMVQRRGAAVGGEAAELGRMAGEQEAALRSLVAGGVAPGVPAPRGAAVPAAAGAGVSAGAASPGAALSGTGTGTGGDDAGADGTGTRDVRPLLAACSGPRVSFAEPGAPVPLPAAAAGELAAAVGAALDNVRAHARGPSGEEARAWILLEDEPDAVVVTVRDDGPGIPPGRLAAAEAEGRLGVALSIRGRLRELGGSAEWVSVPGQGTEVELRVPRG